MTPAPKTGPLISAIARGSTADGPGLRTVVFLKGCPLRCVWCHNPETHDPRVELSYARDRCNDCGACLPVCNAGALSLDPAAGLQIDRDRCTRCGLCTRVCDRLALRMIGETWSRERLLELLLRDREYYQVSGGGVTFSGGEALRVMQWLSPLVQALHREGVHVAIETCGHFDLGDFEVLMLPWVDLLLFDVKLADPARHQQLTGVGNQRILANLRALLARGRPQVQVRIPLVPGLTATRDNLLAIADLLGDMGVREATLLPYNPSGSRRWAQLGKRSPEGLPLRPYPYVEEQAIRAVFDARLRAAAERAQPAQDSPT